LLLQRELRLSNASQHHLGAAGVMSAIPQQTGLSCPDELHRCPNKKMRLAPGANFVLLVFLSGAHVRSSDAPLRESLSVT
jgi:hypothetical protein